MEKVNLIHWPYLFCAESSSSEEVKIEDDVKTENVAVVVKADEKIDDTIPTKTEENISLSPDQPENQVTLKRISLSLATFLSS